MTFTFSAPLWLWQGKGAWHFVTLPEDIAHQVSFFSGEKRGFGSVRVIASCGNSKWQTSLFPDKKSRSYLLPVKAEVRKAENLHADDMMEIEISLPNAL